MKTYRAARAAPLELVAEVRKHSGVLRKHSGVPCKHSGVFGRSRPAAGLADHVNFVRDLAHTANFPR